MTEEKTIYRIGQVLGIEKVFCPRCNKKTDQQVVCFSPKKSILAGNAFAAVGIVSYFAADSLLNHKLKVKVPTSLFYGYVCNECKSLSIVKDWKETRKKYGWSAFYGFKGIPKQKIEFKVWKK